jgi:hypothetical protein
MIKKKKNSKSKYNINSAELFRKTGKRSPLEIKCEAMLIEAGIPFEYEPRSYELAKGFKFCSYDGSKGVLKEKCIGRPVTYKPDFVCPNETWFIEVKGRVTEGFTLRWKAFRAYCAEHNSNAMLIIAHNYKELEAAIILIKKHLENEGKISSKA